MPLSLQNKNELKCKHHLMHDNVNLLLVSSIDDFLLAVQAAYVKIIFTWTQLLPKEYSYFSRL